MLITMTTSAATNMKSTIKPNIVWETSLKFSGCDKHKGYCKLNGSLEISGVPHHIEAFEIRYDKDGLQEAVCPEWCNFDELSEIVQGAMQTVTFAGREYVILVTPFQM